MIVEISDGDDDGDGDGDGDGGDATRRPQSEQSEPSGHEVYSAPSPPSSQSPSEVNTHVSATSAHTPPPGRGGGEGAGEGSTRAPQSEQSEPRGHAVYSEPTPPSSHSPSAKKVQMAALSTHEAPVGVPAGAATGGGGGGGGGSARPPQSLQSVDGGHAVYSEPGPPSSHSPSKVYEHSASSSTHAPVDVYRGAAGGGEIAAWLRAPQSVQSAPSTHAVNSEPAPPSSQSPSAVKWHVSAHSRRVPGGTGGGGLGGGESARAPQSAQSVPSGQSVY